MNYLYYYIFLLLIIIFCLASTLISNTNSTENFTPGIRRLYRPYVRSARLFSEDFLKNSKNQMNSFLKRAGLY